MLDANQTQVLSQVKILLAVIGTIGGTLGYFKNVDLGPIEDQILLGLGALMVLGAMFWSWYSKRKAGLIKSAANVLGDSGHIVTDSATAIAVDHPNVISNTSA